MRQIKFRGRCAITGAWRYGFYYISKGNHIIRDYQDRESIVLSATVGQFTGLTDKNSKEIYEGDVMKYGRSKFSVVFDPKYGYVSEFSKVNTNICIPIYIFEIIGTIHDGKEVKS